MQEFDTAAKLQKQRKPISERRDALAAFVAELQGQRDAATVKECEFISCSVEGGRLVRVGGIMKGPDQHFCNLLSGLALQCTLAVWVTLRVQGQGPGHH